MGETASFGAWLRRRRKALDLTQHQLADQAGCAVSTLVKIENETRRPSREMAERLADVLEIPIKERAAFLNAARRHEPTSPESLPQPDRATQLDRPQPPTRLIGRDSELAAIHTLLERADCRLLTIVGPGGIGKTRLALQAAHDLHDRFDNGVIFVSLAPLTSGDQLPAAIAAALDFSFSGVTEPHRQLIDYVRHKRLLLVLDNLEHLIDAAATIELVNALLDHAARSTLLITSRERLNIQREWTFEVQGLAVPPAQAREQLEAYPAAVLFLQHARRVQPAWTFTPHDESAIARICRAVEGLPLALELAAAWLPMLTCAEIAGELERDIGILRSTARDVPERHRSMRAVFDYSWQMLTADEQRVLQALSVFRGTFTRAAAQAVAQADLDTLLALVTKSLLRRAAEGRYDLHELVQQYAAAKLQLDPTAETAERDRHAAFYLGAVCASLPRLKTAEQQAVLHDLNPDIDNVRAAWHWATNQAALDELQCAAWAVWYFFDLHNLYREYVQMFQQAEAALERVIAAQPGRVELTIALHQLRVLRGFSGIRLGQIEDMRLLVRESVLVLQQHNAQAVLTDALWVYGLLSWLSGEFETAAQVLQESIALNRELGQLWQVGLSLAALGAVRHDQGHPAEAYTLLKESVNVCQQVGVPRNTTFAVGLLARTAQALGYHEDLPPLLREQLRLAIEMNDRSAAAFALEHLGLARQAEHHTSEACEYIQQAIAHYLDLGDLWSASRTLNYAGQFELSLTRCAEARQFFTRARQAAIEGHVPPNALDAMLGLAEVNIHEGRVAEALDLIDQVLNDPVTTPATRDRAGQLRGTLLR